MADNKGKYSNIIRQAKEANEEPEIDTQDMSIEQLRKRFDRDDMENLSVRVPKTWKRHWVIQSKIKDVTLTDIMCRGLAEELGLPEED